MSTQTNQAPAEPGLQTSIKPLLAQSNKALADRMKLTLNYDELTNCMRCGFCQPSCPTFVETGIEAASPRGRIALMKAVADGLMDPDETFRQQIDLCLGCRACEPVCPADVKYGSLLEQTRDAIERNSEHGPMVKLVRNVTLRGLFPHPGRMRLLGFGLKAYQKSGLRTVARKIGILKLFPKHLRQMENILPNASSTGVVKELGTTVYPAKGRKIATVGMFRGCIMDMMFTGTNVNTVKLLSEAGFEVVIPDTQTCCGALHAHSGEMDQAKALARTNIDVFAQAGVEYIVSNAGGCGALLVEYGHLLHDDEAYADKAKAFAKSVKDVSQIIMELGDIPSFAAKPEESRQQEKLNITYQESCHLRNVMRASNGARDLMQRVADVNFVELTGADKCCGSAGIYNIVQPKMANQILEHKMEHVKETNAHYLLTSNPGCLLQMKLGIENEQMSDRMKAVHIVDFLYERINNKDK